MKKNVIFVLLIGLIGILGCSGGQNDLTAVTDTIKDAVKETADDLDILDKSVEEDSHVEDDLNAMKEVESETSNSVAVDENIESETQDNKSSDDEGIRSEFKQAMDSYEAFYDEYCDIMKKYSENPTDMSIMSDYMELVGKQEQVDKDFEKWNGDMNEAETKYYMEVTNRVLKKLSDVY